MAGKTTLRAGQVRPLRSGTGTLPLGGPAAAEWAADWRLDPAKALCLDPTDKLQAAGRLGTRAGAEVRHPYCARYPTRVRRAQPADRGFQLQSEGCSRPDRRLPV